MCCFLLPLFLASLLLSLLVPVVEGTPSFISHQYILFSTKGAYTNATDLQVFPLTYPQGHDYDHQLGLALAGYSLAYASEIEIEVGLGAYYYDGNVLIFVQAGASTHYRAISVYVVLVRASLSTWAWISSHTHPCLSINTTGSTSQLVVVPTPSLLSVPYTDYLVLPYLTGYHAFKNNDSQVGLELQISSLTNSFYSLSIIKTDSSIVKKVFFSVLLINKPDMLAAHNSFYNDVHFEYNNSTLNSVPTNWNIPGSGGYDRRCVIGLASIHASGSTAMQLRTMIFDARTDPFGYQVSDIPDLSPGVPQYVQCMWHIFCILECPVGSFQNVSTSTCYQCPINCQSCSSIAFCTSCLYPFQLINNACLTCMDGYYLSSSPSTCSLCSSVIDGCYKCTNNNTCNICHNAGLYTYSADHHACLKCQDLYDNCLICNRKACVLCLDGTLMHSNNLSCLCPVGQLVNGMCNSVTGCIELSIIDMDVPSCIACDPTLYYPLPINNYCICLTGNMVSGQCLAQPGCISAPYPPVCAFCNIQKHFNAIPVDGTCTCQSHYQLIGQACQEVCGDGRIVSLEKQQDRLYCDDGNKADFDGCDAQCRVEVDYRCYNGSANSSSRCVYSSASPLTLQLKRIYRSQGLNQGVFQFTLSPSLSLLSQMDLYSQVSLSCSDTTYSISSMTYSNGLLQLVADYTTDMQTRACRLEISYDRQLFSRLPPNTLDFSAISQTTPLVVSSKLQEYSILKLLFEILSWIVLGVFLFSAVSHKMIGPQLLLTHQLVYLSHDLYQRQSFMMGTVEQLRPVTAWTTQVEQQWPFLQQSGYLVLALIIAAIVLLLGVISRTLMLSVQPKQSTPRLSLFIKILYCKAVFPIAVGFALTLSFSLSQARLARADSISWLNSGAQLLVWLTVSCVFAVEMVVRGYWKGLIGVEGGKYWYVPVFLSRMALLMLLLQRNLNIPFAQSISYSLLSLQLFYLLPLLFYSRPYYSSLDNLGVLLGESTALYAILLAIANNLLNGQLKQTTQVMLIIAMMGLLFADTFIAILRLLIHCRNNIRKDCLKNSEGLVKEVQPQSTRKRWEILDQQQQQVEQRLIHENPYLAYRFNHNLTPLQLASATLQLPRQTKHTHRPIRQPNNLQQQDSNRDQELQPERQQELQLKNIKSKLKDSLIQQKRQQNKIPPRKHPFS